MALTEQEVKDLKLIVDSVRGMEISALIGRPEWGAITFVAAAGALKSINEIALMLSDLPLERLPSSAAVQIRDALTGAYGVMSRINNFAIDKLSNPTGERDQLVNELLAQEQAVYQYSQHWIPFLAYLRGDIPKQLEAITNSVSAATSGAENFNAYVATRTAEIEKIVLATREASAKAGVAHFTQDFSRDASARDEEAGKWLTRALVSAGLTLVVAIVFFFVTAPDTTLVAVQFATSKVVILAMLIATTAWCAGNYKANKHQAVVSRHKAHSLATFQAFMQASDDPHVRDAVLLETTRSIFAHVPSGYLRADAPSDSGSKIVEIIKTGSELGSKA